MDMNTYKYQLHAHTLPCSACARMTPQELVESLHRSGYQGCVITNHFMGGNSGIDVKDIISLSFETRDGRRYFVVKARDKKGQPYERLALMAKKDVTEEDVRRFLYDVNLAHLYVVSEDDTRESAEGFGQD